MALGHDPAKVAGSSFDRGLVGRVWNFARPYRWMLAAFLGAIVAASLLDIVPPLVFAPSVMEVVPALEICRAT